MKRGKSFLQLILISNLFMSCAVDNDRKNIAQAQLCLDSATVDNVGECRSLLDGIDKPEAYRILCSIDFFEKGLTEDLLAESFSRQESEDTLGDPILGMMGFMAFPTAVSAESAKEHCSKSGIKTYAMFGSMAVVSTNIGSFNGGGILEKIENGEEPTQEEMEDALQDALTNPSSEINTVIGQAVVDANSEYCDEENEETNICQNISEALEGGSTMEEIGEAMLQALE